MELRAVSSHSEAALRLISSGFVLKYYSYKNMKHFVNAVKTTYSFESLFNR